MAPGRRCQGVVVVLRRRQGAESALRAAVGYVAGGLRVQVVLLGEAEAVLGETGAAVARPLATLRALGHEVLASPAAIGAGRVVVW